MSEKELVIELGIEGGGSSIYRTQQVDGGWHFHVEGSSMFLDENDDEDWRSWSSEPVLSIEDALGSVAKDGSWVLYHPISVHPEYRTAVWKLVQDTASRLPEEQLQMWTHKKRMWQRVCKQVS